MDASRRHVLRAAGIAIAGAPLAGCLAAPTLNGGDTGGDGGDLPRVDTPPYAVAEPECDPPEDGRDPLWLCENMAAEPSLPFDQVETRGPVLHNEGLGAGHDGTAAQFYVALLTDEDDLSRVDRERGSAAVDLIAETNFGSAAVLVAQTGWGSGSVTPRLKRIEETDDGVHAFGCYHRPCVWTDDYTSRVVVARFERPETLFSAVVSLTVDAETRVTVAAADGAVTVE
jgi:hypothetical protein